MYHYYEAVRRWVYIMPAAQNAWTVEELLQPTTKLDFLLNTGQDILVSFKDSVPPECDTWKKRDGTNLELWEMDVGHLRNAIHFLDLKVTSDKISHADEWSHSGTRDVRFWTRTMGTTVEEMFETYNGLKRELARKIIIGALKC